MAALGWLLNLGFAGSGVIPPTAEVSERFDLVGTDDTRLPLVGTLDTRLLLVGTDNTRLTLKGSQ